MDAQMLRYSNPLFNMRVVLLNYTMVRGFVFWEIMGKEDQPLKHVDTKPQGSKLRSIIYTGNLQVSVFYLYLCTHKNISFVPYP
jgi:hypothetical protein